MSLKEARTYGSIGAILSLLGGLIPRVGLLVTITGMIMILFAVKEISNEFKREDIFRSYLVALILRLGAFVVLIIAVLFGSGLQRSRGCPSELWGRVFGH